MLIASIETDLRRFGSVQSRKFFDPKNCAGAVMEWQWRRKLGMLHR